jgi:hypothetical protein
LNLFYIETAFDADYLNGALDLAAILADMFAIGRMSNVYALWLFPLPTL